MAKHLAGFVILLVVTFICPSASAQSVDENENRIMQRVAFTGLSGKRDEGLLDESLAYKVVRESGLKISEGGVYDAAGVEKTIADLKQWLATKGYLDAKVEAIQSPSPKDEKVLTFAIQTGEKVRVSKIVFTGNKFLTDDELLGTLKNCYKDFWETYDAEFYDYCLRAKTRELAFQKGFVKAETGAPQVERTAAGLILTIPVSEGRRYRLGTISIEGAKTFSAAEIREMFGQKNGDVFDRKALRDFLFVRLNKLYSDKGFSQYEAYVEPEYVDPANEADDGTVNLRIVLNEGRRSN